MPSAIQQIRELINLHTALGSYYITKRSNRELELCYAGMYTGGETVEAATMLAQLRKAFRKEKNWDLGFEVVSIHYHARLMVIRTFTFRTGW